MSVVIALDHDGTLSKYDIGKDYLSHSFPEVYKRFNARGKNEKEKFSYVVEEIRSGKYNNFIKNELGLDYDSERDHGTELAIMVLLESKYDGITKEKIEDIVKDVARNNHVLKDGAAEFLRNDGYETWISTAGVENFIGELFKVYDINHGNENFYIVGTKLKYDKNGKPQSIIQKNGRYQKGENLKKIISNDDKIIAVGDSSGDSKVMDMALKNDGVAISSGRGADKYSGIYVLDKNGSFFGEIASIIASKNILDGKESKVALEELESYFGKPGMLNEIEFGIGNSANENSRVVFDILKKFAPRNNNKKIFTVV